MADSSPALAQKPNEYGIGPKDNRPSLSYVIYKDTALLISSILPSFRPGGGRSVMVSVHYQPTSIPLPTRFVSWMFQSIGHMSRLMGVIICINITLKLLLIMVYSVPLMMYLGRWIIKIPFSWLIKVIPIVQLVHKIICLQHLFILLLGIPRPPHHSLQVLTQDSEHK